MEETDHERREVLDAFGKLLMHRVRDSAIIEWDGTLVKRLAPPSRTVYAEWVETLSREQQAILYRLVPDIVDTVIHHLLWTLQQVDWVDVAVRTSAGAIPSIRESGVSEGLEYETYDWIPKFSTQRYDRSVYDE